MPVSGTYKYEKGENIEGFLVAIGVKEDKAKAIASVTDKTVTLNYTGDKLEVEAKGKETSHNTLTIGFAEVLSLSALVSRLKSL
ncbi:hypothetical protein Avbf_14236 [Armadillidium vulgare]|nr:hypothetical protein Avbf_14236 [Armadillidium vulgare]